VRPLKRKIRQLSVILFSALIVTGLGLTLVRESSIFYVEKINIHIADESGDFCLKQKSLCQYLEAELNESLSTEVGKKIWQVDIHSLRNRIIKNKWFKTLAVSRLYPNKINVEASIEQPIALLNVNSEIFALNDRGEILQAVKYSFLPVRPVFKGENLFKDLELRKLATQFLKNFSMSSELSVENIAELTYSKDDYFTLLILPSHSIVKMSSDHVKLKAARVSQVIEYLNTNQLSSRVIDARFSKKVLVRLRKGS
jgi:cell division protein FtsQ